MDKIIETYDTTLRFATFEGSEGIKLEERLAIIRMLDSMGITYIDIGTPENSEEYDRFLKQVLELQLESAVLTPFIRAKDCGRRIGMEPAVLKILEMDAQTVCVEGECSEYVIRDEGKMRLEENLWQISQVISWFRSRGKAVIFNAHNFFDSLSSSSAYTREVIKTASSAGADRIVLCDSSGYALFQDITAGIDVARMQHTRRIGIQCANSSGCADSNAVVAAKSGVMHIQGSFLGTGPNGNISLAVTIANLQINMGYSCIPYMKLNRLTHAAEYIADQMDVSVPPAMPYVGRLAFAEEIPMIPNSRSANMVHPEVVGNSRRMNLMTSYALTVLIERMNKMGYKVTRDLITSLDIWKEYHRGYATEVSIALQILRGLGEVNSVFTIQDVKVLTERIAGTDYDRTHVMMESTLGGEKRLSSGVGTDIVEAFWEAVQDAVSDKIKNARNIKINEHPGTGYESQRVQRDSGCHQWRACLERVGGGADRTALPVQHGLRCNRLSSADDGILSGKEIGLDTDRRGSLAFPSVFFCDRRKRWRNLRHSSNISDTVPFVRGRRPWWMLCFRDGMPLASCPPAPANRSAISCRLCCFRG